MATNQEDSPNDIDYGTGEGTAYRGSDPNVPIVLSPRETKSTASQPHQREDATYLQIRPERTFAAERTPASNGRDFRGQVSLTTITSLTLRSSSATSANSAFSFALVFAFASPR